LNSAVYFLGLDAILVSNLSVRHPL
jgi:hypothetical protein